MNIGGVDTGLDLDRNWSLRSRTPYDSIGAVTYGSIRLDVKSWNVAQDPKNFGFEFHPYIYTWTVIYRHRK